MLSKADAYGRQILDAAEGTDVPVRRILREQVAPRIEIESTDFGVRIFTVREITDELRHVRVPNYLFPNAAVVAVSSDWGLLQVHVPIDDEHNWATEGAGPTQDRTTEHLGSQDKAIIASRRMLLDALKRIEQGGDPPVLDGRRVEYQDLATIDTVTPADAWQTAWRERHAARVSTSPWAARVGVGV
jgi:hypothetical protein